jgi:hypothetical protein
LKTFYNIGPQTDLCSWIIDQTAPADFFYWDRTTGKQLEDKGIEGPNHDHVGLADRKLHNAIYQY